MFVKGMLVELPSNKGIGKIEAIDASDATVSVFYSASKRELLPIKTAELLRAYLSRHTRVYLEGDGKFRVGRVINYLRNEDGSIEYEVKFPNGEIVDCAEREINVRLWSVPDDPADVLAAGAAESQYLFDRRLSAVSTLLKLKGATQGLTAVSSASVDVVGHQISAVRRVLTDPIQRYLLADEVGLGKTIEAGLIVRQHLIDDPATTVAIVVPEHLLGQWSEELRSKLRFDQFQGAVRLISHSDARHLAEAPAILVVDEAHHLVGVDDGALQVSSRHLRQLARQSKVVLLLSATPALSDEGRFLALLNLLDPDSYALDDLESFRTKLEQRRDFGRILLALDPEKSKFVLRQKAGELRDLLPHDPTIQVLVSRLIESSRDGTADLAALCFALKDYVADTYRIHHRLIRSRRADMTGWEFLPRGPGSNETPNLSHVKFESFPEGSEGLADAIEDWRYGAALSVTEANADLSRLVQRYAQLIEVSGSDPSQLGPWIDTLSPLFLGERAILTTIKTAGEHATLASRLGAMIDSTQRLIRSVSQSTRHPKIVVFSSSDAVASEYFEAARLKLHDHTVTLLLDSEGGNGKAALDAFRDADRPAICVVGRAGEEGLNLAFADAIVHLDLPLSAARLEQRIGRLDRFGRRNGIIRHRIFVPTDDDGSPWDSWANLLSQAFLVFNRSISDVQFLLSGLEAEGFEALLMHGAQGMANLRTDFSMRIEHERRSQDEQYALDKIALSDDGSAELVEAFEAAEEDEGAIEKAMDRWLLEVLHLSRQPLAPRIEDPFKFVLGPAVQIPFSPWLERMKATGDTPLTWRRGAAIRQSSLTLLRPGATLVDEVDRYTNWDDRGTAFITLRQVPGLPARWIGFRLEFVLEPALALHDLLAPSYVELAKLRRACGYLSQRMISIVMDINANEVHDPTVIGMVTKDYKSIENGGYDLNLSSRPDLFSRIIDRSIFVDQCRIVRDKARRSILESDAIQNELKRARSRAEADLKRHQNRLARGVGPGNVQARRVIADLEDIVESIVNPCLRLEAMGGIVLTPAIKARASNGFS